MSDPSMLSEAFGRRAHAAMDVLAAARMRKVRWNVVRPLALVAASLWGLCALRLHQSQSWEPESLALLIGGLVPAAAAVILLSWRRTWVWPRPESRGTYLDS